MKNFLKRYSHAWIIIAYTLIYIPWFMFLEKNVKNSYHIIHMAVDDIIPFCEYFIVPYLLWFFYIAATVIYFIFTNKSEYKKLCAFLITGMTVFLLVSTFYPNGATLRPTVFPHNNIFTRLVIQLYSTDTPTNIFPSIHVYNSLGCYFAISTSEKLSKNKPVLISSFILTFSIILATMFLKQHSVFDVITAFALSTFMYFAIYVVDYNSIAERTASSKVSQRSLFRRNQA
ncbi:MAG: phosphatase PAP2 family protein [Lachnospiraceae bacterium]|nr:phosphatase PAP2 family protein [Lachnospiraceae bacterium]